MAILLSYVLLPGVAGSEAQVPTLLALFGRFLARALTRARRSATFVTFGGLEKRGHEAQLGRDKE